ncbi:GNAT family N-acetyltransferase [Lysinibacillus sphaericus]|uniref:Acetyltransferase, ribosomal protein N-acetylase n=1 Tax=Lysinibacillus sphaericus OT4b.31 TaxID=1285586 RepID=R7ZG83_LYSSH|nr:GNAT family N-acetyltransferase [Lysinibacillus sphaericus]EON73078.1 acetyltransferase, ribosomal protein N-acetylase [Lysinibacillus sphaericus OT4b.31]
MFLNLHIETERLVIRPYALTDVDALYAVVSEPNFYQFIPEDIPSREEVQRIIQWSINCNQKNTPTHIHKLNLAIVEKESQTVIGFCGLGPDDVKQTEVEIYYGISEAYRGRGITSEATYALMDYAFKVIALPRIIAVVHSENLASICIIEKLGMSYEFTYNNLDPTLHDFEGLLNYTIDAETFLSKHG